MSEHVQSNVIGWGSAGLSVASGKVLNVIEHDTLAEAEEEVSMLDAGLTGRARKRIRWAVVEFVERPRS